MAGILWLASYPKSGNTWMRAFLANLFTGSKKPLPINELPNHILGDNFFLHYEQLSKKRACDLSDAELRALRPKVHMWFATYKPDTVIVKTHSACVFIEGQPLITPQATAGAIYIARNPMDVAVSYANHYQISIERTVELLCDNSHTVPRHGDQLEQYVLGWSMHVESWLKAKGMRLHLVRYEDMLAKPLKTFGNLVKFLQLPEDRQRLKRAIEFSSFRQLKAQEEKGGFVESRPDGKARFFRKGRSGDWREKLTAEQTDRLIAAHRDTMIELGYLKKNGKLAV